ncbi:ABC transporter transmembrane domain-containing protein [Robbsia andropogonis]|uniref:ABC transporter transmembrane domain-containing protein n=1 Tax=Robbsia andropogonis TaxID=28092 RepID=UPI000466A5B9|nr:ABC transporter transmembrane domain-containing protein [Robbsia andropogonis]MCP1120751.1 ABC transporter transmembrane domain-containing protein [Robbsia andropogonis]MCP1130574.1 ABC transporter transmembrane domain-containing protein [Robbsia andropogonis]
MSLLRLLATFTRQQWRPYAASAVMLAGVAVLSVMIPRMVGRIIDGLVAHQLHLLALMGDLAILLAMGLAIYFLRVGWRVTLYAAAYKLGTSLRERIYRTLALQSPGFFHRHRTGDLMARATNDIDAVEMTAGEALLAGFDGSMTLILVVAMMTGGIDWRLSLAALLPFPFMAFGFWLISNRIHHAWRDSLGRFSTLNDHVQETLSGVRTVRALGLEAHNANVLAKLARDAANSNLEAQRWEAAFSPVVGIALTASTTITLAYGGYLVWTGQMTIGNLTSFSMYLGQLIWPMFAAGWVLSLIERGRAAWTRLNPLLSAESEVDDNGTGGTAEPSATTRATDADNEREGVSTAATAQTSDEPALVFDAVTFSYADQPHAAITDVSFPVAAGSTLGIVGTTGAGKSTLLRLLLRHYPLQQGDIRWHGASLATYSLQALREQVAWVPQEAFLFSASVADNIALARPDASREDIARVARLAAVHDDILRLPQGYETPVGERGVSLSGGQRQRIAIARALLADAPLLLLDDALSAVDTGTETQILRHLRAARRGRTVLIVSHRLSAVADADDIIVLGGVESRQEGHIIEHGNHDTLLERDGWYARQWRYQQLEASLDAS